MSQTPWEASTPGSPQPGAFNPFAPPPPKPRRRSGWVALALSLALLLVAGGGAVVAIQRHNAQIEAANARAEAAAGAYYAELREWNTKLSAIEQPEPAAILSYLYVKDGGAEARAKVRAGCAQYERYAAGVKELAAPPGIAAMPADVAQRVPAYARASEEADAQRSDFEARRDKLTGDLKRLATFCDFYDREAKVAERRAANEKAWRAKLWPTGHRETIGSMIYTCRHAEGCVPEPAQWPALVPAFHAAFTEPDGASRSVFIEHCPYQELATECSVLAATYATLVAQDKAVEAALKARDEQGFDESSRVSTDFDFEARLRSAMTKATGRDFSSTTDPGATVIYEAVRANVGSIHKAAPAVADSGTIAS